MCPGPARGAARGGDARAAPGKHVREPLARASRALAGSASSPGQDAAGTAPACYGTVKGWAADQDPPASAESMAWTWNS
jgi:hypothetical protein